MTDFSVRMIPIADLRDHPRNSNRHGDRQLEVLATRWRDLGWYKNVVVAEWEGTTTLLAGHGIVAGARAAGATEAPCHVRNIDPLSPEALDILEGDNTVADLAEPDLHERLRNLVELDAAGRLGNVGYDDQALDRLKAELQAEDFAAKQGPPVEDPGPSEPPAEPVSKLGDVWICGLHRVVCGDCTEAGVWDAEMFGAVVTDPPYNVGFSYDGAYAGKDNKAPREYGEWLWGILCWLEERLLPGAPCFVWQAMLNVRHFTDWFPRDWRLFAGIKGMVQFRPTPVQFSWDPVVFWFKDGPDRITPMAGRRDYVVSSTATWLQKNSSNIGHPCPRPLDAVEYVMGEFTLPGDIVADPFLGSGTTLIAAEQLGRVCYGIEIEPRYVDVAVRRWQQATGQTAILESTGQPFPDVT